MNPNKIYIVTAGEYSDYHIERVFLDETKARNYAKYHQKESWGGMRVEEYEFDDESYELVAAGYFGVVTKIKACKKRGPRPFFTETPPKTKAHLEEKKMENETYFLLERASNADKYGSDSLTIWVTCHFHESTGEERAKVLAEKTAYDILAEINSHIVEGDDVGKVIDLMEKKYEGNQS